MQHIGTVHIEKQARAELQTNPTDVQRSKQVTNDLAFGPKLRSVSDRKSDGSECLHREDPIATFAERDSILH